MDNKLKSEMVPDEVYEAWHAAFFSDAGGRAAIAAALNAWPGMRKDWTSAFADEVALILPLTEKQDDKA